MEQIKNNLSICKVIESNLNKLNISISLSKKKAYSLLHSKKLINNLIEVYQGMY